jgi:HAD superfamily hydrolase (TIGR01509 family)
VKINGRLKALRGLLFDLDDVLYDDTVWRRWLLRLLTRMGLATHYHSFFRLWQDEHLDAVHRGRCEFEQAFRTFLRSAGMSPGQIDEVQAASQARRLELDASARPLPGVRATVSRLHGAGLVLGVVCNSEKTAAELKSRLAGWGMTNYFRTVVSSIDLGQTKPAAVCYRTALTAMNIPAAEAAFVGHDTVELAGARRAGLKTVAFNYDADAMADAYLERFDELLHFSQDRPTFATAA